MTNFETFSVNNEKLFELTLCRTQESISTALDGETVILDTHSGIYSGLDSVGTFIWDQLMQPATIAVLRDAMLEKYAVTEEQCLADLLVFLKELADNGLIVIQNE